MGLYKRGPARRTIAAVLVLCSVFSLLLSSFGAASVVRAGGQGLSTSVVVTPGVVAAGGQVGISGSGFGSAESVAISLTFNGQQNGAVHLATATTDLSGTFTLQSVAIPANTIANTYLLVLKGSRSNATGEAALQVTGTQAAASVSVNPVSIASGGALTIQGTGFAPGESVSIQLTANPQQAGGLLLGTVQADGTGNFTLANPAIPSSQPAGSYLVVATGLYSNRTSHTPLQLTAAQVPVSIGVSPTSIPAGGVVTITGSGFLAGEQIQLQLSTNTQQLGGLQQATITADGAGNFTIAGVTIPASQPAGSFVVVATGLTSQRQASIPLQVTAQQSAVSVTVNPGSIAAGGQVSISGSGFAAGELLYLTLTVNSTTPGGLQLGTATADSSGNFTSPATTIPATTPNGAYLISVVGSASGRSSTAVLQVTAPQATISANPTTLTPSSSTSISGSGFAANEQVTISLAALNGTSAIYVTQIRADGSGNIASTSLQIPFGVAQGAWQLIATGQSSNRQATVALTINAQGPTLTVSPTTALPGAAIALSGTNFQPGESVVISLVGLNSTTTLATVQADTSGAFSISGTAIALSAAQGMDTVVATGSTSRLSATAPLTVGANSVTLTLSSSSVPAGGTVGANGTGFAAGEAVLIQIHRSTGTPLSVGTYLADSTGSFAVSSLPIARYLHGSFTVSAYGQSSGRVASAALTIQAPSTANAILSIVGSTANQGSPGGLVLVAGSGFHAHAVVTLLLTGLNVTTTLGTISADATGTFGPGGFSIPATLPAATYSLQASVAGKVIATTTLQVVALSPTFTLNVQSLTSGAQVTLSGRGFAVGEQVVLALNGAALLTTPSTVLAGANNQISAKFVVPATINNGLNTITATGTSSHAGFSLNVNGKLAGPTTSFYFPDGDTTNGNRTVISVLNATNATASIKLTFLYAGAPERTVQQTLPARRQVLIDLNLVAGINRQMATIVQSNRQIVAGSTIYYKGADSAGSIGAAAPATTWYLAEGYTGGSFHEFLQIMNPGTSYANVDVRFLPFNGRPPQEHRLVLAPLSTTSLDTSIYMPRASFSTIVTSDKGIVVDRSMRFGTNGRGATAGKGVAAASTVWLFAGGQSSSNRQTFLTVLNPNQASPAMVTAAFFDSSGKPVGNTTVVVNPLSRGNIKLNTVLANSIVAMVVTSNVPVVVERPFYIGPSNLDAVTSGVNVFGRNGGSTSWMFPTGDTTGGDQMQFLIFNASSKANKITATFYTSTGTVVERQVTVPANGGTQLDLNGISGLGTGTFGTMLKNSNGQLFVVERRTTNTALGILDGTQGLAQ